MAEHYPILTIVAAAVTLDWNDSIAEVVIDRPNSGNAVGLAVMDELGAVIATIEDSDAKVVVLRGAGDRVFISGGDLKELAQIRDLASAQAMSRRMREVLDRLASLPIPVVAAMNGDAYGGGGEVAVACDMRIAADDVRVGFSQVRLGIMPAWGGVERLVRLVGRSRAMYLLSTGRVLEGSELTTWGLAEEVVPRAAFEGRWRQLCQLLSEAPREVLVGVKQLAGRVVPPVSVATASSATLAFARTWVADDHWAAAARQAEIRRHGRGSPTLTSRGDSVGD